MRIQADMKSERSEEYKEGVDWEWEWASCIIIAPLPECIPTIYLKEEEEEETKTGCKNINTFIYKYSYNTSSFTPFSACPPENGLFFVTKKMHWKWRERKASSSAKRNGKEINIHKNEKKFWSLRKWWAKKSSCIWKKRMQFR